MPSPIAYLKSLQGWTEHNWPLLGAVRYAFAFAIMLGGLALAAYTANFAGPLMSLAFGGIVIGLVKVYARAVRATQRVIDRLHPPERDEVAATGEVPGWAFFLYMLLGLPLYVWISSQTGADSHPTFEVLIAWFAGQQVFAYFFWRQNNPAAPSAFATIDAALDRWAEPRRPLLRRVEIALGFIGLAGGMAVHAFHSGFARTVALSHAGADTMSMQIMIGAGCGAAAILFARLYVAVTLAAQRTFIDPWRYVRPEPPSRNIERWAVYPFAAIGLVLFLAISIGQEPVTGNTTMTIEGARFRAELDWFGLLALFVGWGGGGYRVLRWFWSKARASAERRHARV